MHYIYHELVLHLKFHWESSNQSAGIMIVQDVVGLDTQYHKVL